MVQVDLDRYYFIIAGIIPSQQCRHRASREQGGGPSNSCKRDRGVPNVPPAPAPLRGQKPRYGLRAVLHHGKRWYKSPTKSKYFPDVPIDADSLAWDIPAIYQQMLEYHMGFVIGYPQECNLSLFKDFYTNLQPEGRTQIMLWGGEGGG